LAQEPDEVSMEAAARETAHDLIQGYLGPDHKVINMCTQAGPCRSGRGRRGFRPLGPRCFFLAGALFPLAYTLLDVEILTRMLELESARAI
jgi:hypothetical protein